MNNALPNNLKALFVAACLLALAASGCGLLATEETITYTRGSVGARDIAVVEASGNGTIIVTSDADGQRSDNYGPVWSPSRQRIAFFTNRDGNAEVYVAVADGSDFLRVTDTLHEETQVSWAADGNRLAYTTVSFDGESSVHWVSLSDLQPHRLLAGSFGETDPTWSPTGPWIAFTRLNEEGESIGLFLRDPSTVNNIPLTTAVDHGPVWSPDGTKIAYISTVDGNEEIHVIKIRSDGNPEQSMRITDSPGRDYAPDWSPDSKSLVFLSDRNDNVDIFTSLDDGSGLRSLTRNSVDEVAVKWGGDGRILFESGSSGRSELFLMDANGAQTQLTQGIVPSTFPDW